MKKILFLLLILLNVLFSSCKTEEESDKDLFTLLCSGVEFPEKDVFYNLRNSWVEPNNYSFTYEYNTSVGSAYMYSEVVDCIVENGNLKSAKFNIPAYDGKNWTQEEYDSLKQELEQKTRKKDFNSVKSIFDFCNNEYENSIEHRYVYKTKITLELDKTYNFPVMFNIHSDDVYTFMHADYSKGQLGFSTSGATTTIRITNFQIN